MIKVGITGGIGSGKTHICSKLEKNYIPIFYTDDESKKILADDIEIKKYVIDNYGKESYMLDGKPNSKFLANILFNDDIEMEKLVNKIYPKLLIVLNKWFKYFENKNKKVVIVESAIMFNSNFATDNLDLVIGVIANTKTRIERVLKRDKHRTYDDILNIIKKQISNDDIRLLSDFIIENNSEEDDVLNEKILKLRNELFLSSI